MVSEGAAGFACVIAGIIGFIFGLAIGVNSDPLFRKEQLLKKEVLTSNEMTKINHEIENKLQKLEKMEKDLELKLTTMENVSEEN